MAQAPALAPLAPLAPAQALALAQALAPAPALALAPTQAQAQAQAQVLPMTLLDVGVRASDRRLKAPVPPPQLPMGVEEGRGEDQGMRQRRSVD